MNPDRHLFAGARLKALAFPLFARGRGRYFSRAFPPAIVRRPRPSFVPEILRFSMKKEPKAPTTADAMFQPLWCFGFQLRKFERRILFDRRRSHYIVAVDFSHCEILYFKWIVLSHKRTFIHLIFFFIKQFIHFLSKMSFEKLSKLYNNIVLKYFGCYKNNRNGNL